MAKKGGEAKKKRKRRKDEKAVGACNDTWLCVSRKREKKKASLMSSKVGGSRKCTSEARRGE